MAKLTSMEDRLRQLAPSSLSEEGIQRMDRIIEDLSKGSVTASGDEGGRLWKVVWRSAAIVLLLLVPATLYYMKAGEPVASGVAPTTVSNDRVDQSQLEVIKTVNHIAQSQDDGLIIPDDGSAPHHRFRYYIVDEEQLRDSQTGIEVVVRQPRYEIITIPVTLF